MSATPHSVRLVRERLTSLLEALPAATSGDVRSVHRARVASRRLRAVLPVLADAADPESFQRARKQVRRITRALGPIRELDVALGHLEELGPPSGASPRALAAVRAYLTDARGARRRAMLAVITPATLQKLQARLALPGEDDAAPVDLDDQVRHARRRAARRARQLRFEVQETGGLYVPERLHAVRIAAKKLRYALEVERELLRSRAVARIDRLKRLQDELGDMHDFEILLEHVRGVQADLAVDDVEMPSELDPLVRVLEERCRDSHAAYLRQRDALLDLCQAVEHGARPARPAGA